MINTCRTNQEFRIFVDKKICMYIYRCCNSNKDKLERKAGYVFGENEGTVKILHYCFMKNVKGVVVPDMSSSCKISFGLNNIL